MQEVPYHLLCACVSRERHCRLLDGSEKAANVRMDTREPPTATYPDGLSRLGGPDASPSGTDGTTESDDSR